MDEVVVGLEDVHQPVQPVQDDRVAGRDGSVSLGEPVIDAFDGFRRLYGLWLSSERPDCRALTCLD